jgi:hypothetical protein
MKKLQVFLTFMLCIAPIYAQLIPGWVSSDSSMMIIEGSGTKWTFGGGIWSSAGQTWMQKGMVNNPPVDSAWAELNLGSFAGEAKYIYIVWHVNGPYRGHAVHYKIFDENGNKINIVVDETKHADGFALSNDTFSGWYCLGNNKINITPTTKLRIFKDSTATPNEYVQSDAIMLTDYPVITSTSPGSVNNFEFMNALSTNIDTDVVGNHWGMQGLSEQFTYTSGDSAKTQLDTSIYSDVPTSYYFIDVSWVYYNFDSINVMNARYSVNGKLLADNINQNRSAINQGGSFEKGNPVGTWSGFYRLSGSYLYSPSNPLIVSMVYNKSLYSGFSFVWDMVRFVPSNNINSVKQNKNQLPVTFTLSQNYPNPFNPSTEIQYSIPQSGIVTLKVYNILGQEVATLVNQEQKAGNYNIIFNAAKLSSGVYFYRIKSGDFSLTKKMSLLK